MDSNDMKDKVLFDLTNKSKKIILDPQDSQELQDFFARKEPGDEITGKFEATLDEAGSKVISLSITKFSVDDEEGDDESAEPEEDGEEEGAPAKDKGSAVEMFKNGDGVPSQEGDREGDNVPSQTPTS